MLRFDPTSAPITLANRASLLYWRHGTRIEFRAPVGRLARAWRWLTKQNLRVARIDFEREQLWLEWCR